MDLREKYLAIKPGYHMNKLHWNTVTLDGSIPDDVLKKMVDHSYELVFQKLTRLEKGKIDSI
jgi:predicted DNA-binding protein (MmcQ/YjbR family)